MPRKRKSTSMRRSRLIPEIHGHGPLSATGTSRSHRTAARRWRGCSTAHRYGRASPILAKRFRRRRTVSCYTITIHWPSRPTTAMLFATPLQLRSRAPPPAYRTRPMKLSRRKVRASCWPRGSPAICKPSIALSATTRDIRDTVNGSLDWGAALLRKLPAETAHRATLSLLRLGAPFIRNSREDDPRLAVSALGLSFPNPIGLAAGFDKDARVPDVMLKLGFGFVECGTITPRPQRGNPRPRLFRLVENNAVINRMGFNNGGAVDAAARLKLRARRGVAGVNIGANKDSDDRIADYRC